MTTDGPDSRTRATSIGAWLHRWQNPLWVAVVVLLFCAPLFVGLGSRDLGNDEAIYAYAVDSVLETDDWLNPRSSPNPDIVFLEKPPLKTWLVALPMRLGLLPHNEFGFRFWDALFGSAAFLYVFALGRRMAGPLCGLLALVVLCAFGPLWFEHGLRDNVMEASLVLAYCGGVFHFLRWSESTEPRGRRWHAAAVGLFFVLGFMTKFVAVLFLPLVLAATSVCVPAVFTKVRREWRWWAGVAALALVLIVPWFAYEAVHLGHFLWDVMFAQHVMQRMTSALDPEHLHGWSFYVSELYGWTKGTGVFWLAVAGALLIAVRYMRERWREGIIVLLWLALPLTLISFGTSKLGYYMYPYLPPFALAVAYLLCWLWEVTRSPVDRLITRLHQGPVGLKMPRALRVAFLVACAIATAGALATLVYGGFEIRAGAVRLYSSRTMQRPALFAVLFGVLGTRGLGVSRLARIFMLLALVPVSLYRDNLPPLLAEDHTLRSARDCVLEVRESERLAGRVTPTLLAALPPLHFVHSFYFYLRGAGFDSRFDVVSDDTLNTSLHVAGKQRPVLLPFERYVELLENGRGRAPVSPIPGALALSTWLGPIPAVDDWIGRSQALGMVNLTVADVRLLLPGPYAVCGNPPAVGPMLSVPAPSPQSPGPSS